MNAQPSTRSLGRGRRRLARTATFVVTAAVGTAITWTAAAPAFAAAAPVRSAIIAPPEDFATVPVTDGKLVWGIHPQIQKPGEDDDLYLRGDAKQGPDGAITFTRGAGKVDADGNVLTMNFKGEAAFFSAHGYSLKLSNLGIGRVSEGQQSAMFLYADVKTRGGVNKHVGIARLDKSGDGWTPVVTGDGATVLDHAAFGKGARLEKLTFSHERTKTPAPKPAPSPKEAPLPEGNALSWAVDGGFMPPAIDLGPDGGTAEFTGGAKMADSRKQYVFPVGKVTSKGSGAAASTTVTFAGAVQYKAGAMVVMGDLKLSGIKAVIQGRTGYLTADVTTTTPKVTEENGVKKATKVHKTSSGVRLAALDLAKAKQRSGKGGGTVLQDIPATLTADGAKVLGLYGYKKGKTLAPVTLSYGVR
ncbi:HtaA domain-containing protein [Streptomyces luteireticuli]|uniref:Htaa domain-containing protein n=1 Tax=Streptomyces luteireticuli TaxID=173858 RepID=A0ABN0YRW4_9ACTN